MALKELKLLRKSQRKQNVAYEEIGLTPSAINTTENVAYGHISNSLCNELFKYLYIIIVQVYILTLVLF